MKTGNTLRIARNSLLCFFMALAASFLVACGGGGGGDVATPLPGGNGGGGGGGGGGVVSTFPAYLVDAPVEGAEYSGPTRPVKDVTGKNGEFEASEGVFEFSVGATTLGSVRLSSSSAVTPADFIGVDEAKAIEIARILQALDFRMVCLKTGFQFPKAPEKDSQWIYSLALQLAAAPIPVNLDGVNLTIPPADDAEAFILSPLAGVCLAEDMRAVIAPLPFHIQARLTKVNFITYLSRLPTGQGELSSRISTWTRMIQILSHLPLLSEQ